jgi:hypothetical protein
MDHSEQSPVTVAHLLQLLCLTQASLSLAFCQQLRLSSGISDIVQVSVIHHLLGILEVVRVRICKANSEVLT